MGKFRETFPWTDREIQKTFRATTTVRKIVEAGSVIKAGYTDTDDATYNAIREVYGPIKKEILHRYF